MEALKTLIDGRRPSSSVIFVFSTNSQVLYNKTLHCEI